MKVTPTKKKFGKYAPGQEFELPDKTAKVFIKLGKLSAVVAAPALTQASQTYSTRMMTAETPASAAVVDSAPYGYKADGTPRKRPGRTPAAGD